MKSAMKWGALAVVLLFAVIAAFVIFSPPNRCRQEGSLTVPGLREPVSVIRDEKGMAYIYAKNQEDALLAWGFVTAQDRLFQMELTRLVAAGRISEMIGEKGEGMDTRMRTIGFLRHAKRHAEIVSPETSRFVRRYVEGVNAYIRGFGEEHPLEFKLAGIAPGLWDVADSMALMYFMSWNSAANMETEIIAQMLVEKLGPEKAKEIFPLNINPDDPLKASDTSLTPVMESTALGLSSDKNLLAYLQDLPLRFGSNNWVAGRGLSLGGGPILANDPHLDARILPGPWYPCGIITPEFRVVGAGIPGVPTIVVGRNDRVAMGVTNAYGDAQDLYIETVDPDDPTRYVEGEESIPFEVLSEKLIIKDKNAPGGKREKEIRIRMTRRGPVVSVAFPHLRTEKVVTLRWAPFETMNPFLGIERLLGTASAEDVRNALSTFNIMMLNFVFADKTGNIGWVASGRLPVRSQGDGTVPYVVKDRKDNWVGWIPYDKMPQTVNPERGWVGTCNHNLICGDYPFYYSSYLSPSYRYRRLTQLLDKPGKKSVEDHWRFQRDALNLMASEIAPVMAGSLKRWEDTAEIGDILSRWDHVDDPDQTAPTLFQSIYREFALLVFRDELGEDLATAMLRSWYFWEERLQSMVLEGTSPWFDNVLTKDRRETRDELFHQAALAAVEKLGAALGKNPAGWRWGRVHTIEFVSPLRREGIGKSLLGHGPHPFPGSGETLQRGIYDFGDPFAVTTAASLRMVVDLGDDEKVFAVLPGGVSGRLFHPHAKDQVQSFMNGEKVYWWFSDGAIQEHKKATLTLTPAR